MDEPILDDYEKELVRFCAEWFLAGHDGGVLSLQDFPNDKGDTHEKIIRAANRLVAAGVLGIIVGRGTQALRVEPLCIELVRRWDNPPPRDYWDEATKWFRGRWWTLPFLVLVVAFPLIKGYWDLITLILDCIYPASKKP